MRLWRRPLCSASGFSLIELAVVLTVAGLLLGAAANMMRPYVDEYRYAMTVRKMNNLADALSAFAQTYNRLPCPALANPPTEPFGAPSGSGANGTTFDVVCGAGADADHIGIVPVLALGLTEDQARDGYGNFITYMVTPSLAGSYPANGHVHNLCRTPTWVVGGLNRNFMKARFCCPQVRPSISRIMIYDDRSAGTRKLMFPDIESTGGELDAPDVVWTGTLEPRNRLVAFTLISHGKNGDRALLRGGGTRPVTVSATAQESVNGSALSNVVVRPLSISTDDNYYDDIVVWRTNTQTMAALGNNSCSRP